jgi:hypothetical protein
MLSLVRSGIVRYGLVMEVKTKMENTRAATNDCNKTVDVLYNYYVSAHELLGVHGSTLEGRIKTLVEIIMPPGQQLDALKSQLTDTLWRALNDMRETLHGMYTRSLDQLGVDAGNVIPPSGQGVG